MSRTCNSMLLLCALLCSLVGVRAEAVQRAHVSALAGLDSNTSFNCDVAHPCRFFQAATTVVGANGEVVVLDSGGYGAVTLTQSIALVAPVGVYAGISVFPGANGVTIATAGVNVVLRGLTINGQGGINGVNMTAGAKLTVENCVIANLPGTGIYVNTAASVRVTDTTIRDNGGYGLDLENGARATVTRATISGNGNQGVLVYGTLASTITTADIADSTMDGNNANGVFAYSTIATAVVKVSVRDSRAVRNTYFGLYAQSDLGASVTLSASNNMISKNGDAGIGAYRAGSKVWASGNTVSDNRIGLSNFGGLFESAGNNAVRNNSPDTSGLITMIPTM